jgi:hypothetical protein
MHRHTQNGTKYLMREIRNNMGNQMQQIIENMSLPVDQKKKIRSEKKDKSKKNKLKKKK